MSLGRELLVNAQQKSKKGGISQNAGIHWVGLLGVVTEDSTLGDLVIKIPEGDSSQSIIERDRPSPSWPSKKLPVLT